MRRRRRRMRRRRRRRRRRANFCFDASILPTNTCTTCMVNCTFIYFFYFFHHILNLNEKRRGKRRRKRKKGKENMENRKNWSEHWVKIFLFPRKIIPAKLYMNETFSLIILYLQYFVLMKYTYFSKSGNMGTSSIAAGGSSSLQTASTSTGMFGYYFLIIFHLNERRSNRRGGR